MGPSTLAMACVTSIPPKRAPPSRRSIASREPREAPAGAMARPTAPPSSVTSASSVGPPARIPDAPARTRVGDRRSCPSRSRSGIEPWPGGPAAMRRRPSLRDFQPRRREERRANLADGVLLRLAGQIFDRRLAVDAREHQPGQQRRRARSQLCARLPGDVREIGVGQCRERIDVARAPLRPPRALEQQVVQHEREIERRIAVPCALGVEDHRTRGPDQQVLRAEIAVDQHALRGTRRLDERGEARREVGMRARGRDEIGLEPDRIEDVVGREPRGDVGRSAVAAWIRPSTSPTAAAIAASMSPSRSRSFQTGCASGGRYAIAKHPAARSSPRIAGTAAGTMPPATRIHSTSHRLRSTGARQSAATLSFGSARLTQTGPDGSRRDRCRTRRRRSAAPTRWLVSAHYLHVPQGTGNPSVSAPVWDRGRVNGMAMAEKGFGRSMLASET